MIDIRPVTRHLSIVREFKGAMFYIDFGPGYRTMPIVADCMPVRYNYCLETAVKSLNVMAKILRDRGEIVYVDHTIKTTHTEDTGNA